MSSAKYTRWHLDKGTLSLGLGRTIDLSGPSGVKIMGACLGIGAFLAEKNRQYGDSAISPLRIFSKVSAEEGIKVRLDDKISRLAGGIADLDDEDVVLDLIGYLVLLLICREPVDDV